MDLKKMFAVDEQKENNGVWLEIGEGASLLIARTGNEHYNKLLEKLQKPHRAAIARNKLSNEVAKTIMIELVAKTVLLGWKNIEYGGEKLEYSYENAKMLLTELKDFRELVSDLAREEANFRAIEEEEEIKN